MKAARQVIVAVGIMIAAVGIALTSEAGSACVWTGPRAHNAVTVGRAIESSQDPTTVLFGAGGDIGATASTCATLEVARLLGLDFFLALGDLSYSQVAPESAWCDFVASYLGPDLPIPLVVGNHEDDRRSEGWIGAFAECLPDRMGSVGSYPAEYYFDVAGLVRVIVIGAGNRAFGVDYDYVHGSERMGWLEAAIGDAEERQVPWTVVAMHKNCLTIGEKSCEIGEDLLEVLTSRAVDLVLQGHDHTYQRSVQLTCGVPDDFDARCVADDGVDGEYSAGNGVVFVIAGNTGGGALYETSDDDLERGYIAASIGKGDAGAGYGLVTVRVTEERLEVQFVGSTTEFRDSFVIRSSRSKGGR